jgi:hypothetical protein
VSADIRFAPLNDGSEEECQCARCGSTAIWEDCWNCGGDGEVEDTRDWSLGGLFEMYERCGHCGGSCGWYYCCSGDEWCQLHPMPGREGIQRGAIEWFSIPERSTGRAE